jgi:hypothetical protein
MKKRIAGWKWRYWKKRFDKVLDSCRCSADLETPEYLKAKARWKAASEEYFGMPWYI